MRDLPVCARASRTAVMTASVPELVKRTRSTGPTRRTISSARRTSSVQGAPNDADEAAAALIAATTEGWAWPRIIGPQAPTRSTYSLPSTSQIRDPRARATYRGVPPTDRNARTGELTPTGHHCACAVEEVLRLGHDRSLAQRATSVAQ